MKNSWFISDPHFFHANICKFTVPLGGGFETPLREKFFWEGDESRLDDCVARMNETILDNFNSVVGDRDLVFWLGDITFKFSDEFVKFFKRFRGDHRLIPGNHDDIKKLVKADLFKKVYIWRYFHDTPIQFTCSHIPLHPESIKGTKNVHGHIHAYEVKDTFGYVDPRYLNVCVEKTNYRPLHLDEVLERLRDETRCRKIANGMTLSSILTHSVSSNI